MTNDKSAEEIVRGLRGCIDSLACEKCAAFGRCNGTFDSISDIAAALIESLTAQLNGKTMEIARLHEAIRVKGGTEHAPTEDAYLAVCAALDKCRAQLSASQQETRAARNELCLKCGRYHEAHKGACDGCRWKEMAK